MQKLAGKEGLTKLIDLIFEGIDTNTLFPLVQVNYFSSWIEVNHNFIQHLPFVNRKNAIATRKVRALGRYCIEQRLKALKNKERSLDILSQILSIASE